MGDVQQHDTVDHVRRRDSLHGTRAVGVGDHQDVVSLGARCVRNGQDVLQHRRRELVLVELQEETDDHGLGSGQRPGPRIHGETETVDRVVDAVARLARDRPVA
ncbi:hypothetical protein [Agromyces mangrovi Wang et al. 2018]|uniref:hypothetical protein n=1 Tax=Agromyces mangrovi TaxID=1858653 RepID=UPI00330644F3